MNAAEPDTDILILGGGSAGCVLASRLSEIPELRVTLVEAGEDTPPDAIPARILARYPGRTFTDPRFHWPELRVTLGAVHLNDPAQRPSGRYEQARVMGGGSSINGMGGNRGAPGDYEEWRDLGLPGWGWDDVLPYFKKLERDLEQGGDLHGKDGPIPIRRIPEARWTRFTKAVVAELGARGFPKRADQNGPWEDGVFATALCMDENWQRVSTARGYLTAEVRRRRNLTIQARTQVERLVAERERVIGAIVADAGGRRTVTARETIVSCGAIHSAALLLRSGIGPASDIKPLGIDVVADLRGVGGNLLDHPASSIGALLRHGAGNPSPDDYHLDTLLRFSSGLVGCPPGDMHIAISSRPAWHALGRRLGALAFWVNKSYSRGWVRLKTPDPAQEPEVDFRLLSDPRDLERMLRAFRFTADVMRASSLDDVRRNVFAINYSQRLRQIMRPSPLNAALLAACGLAIDLGGALGARMLGDAASGGAALEDLLADDAKLGDFLQRVSMGVWHGSGTCRMGPSNDPLAVTDQVGRVRKLEGLRVCDASLMPTIPRANINFPIIMMAEKIADAIKGER